MPSTTDSGVGRAFAQIIGQSRQRRACPYCKQPLKTIDVQVGRRVIRGLSCWASCGCERSLRECGPERTRPLTPAERYARAGIGREYVGRRVECSGQVRAVRNGQNVFITGGNGTGKSTLAASIAMTLIDGGRSALFANAAIEALTIRNGFETGGTDSYDRMATAPVLVLDDLGKDNPTEWSTSLWYSVAEARNAARLPTVTTSNYGGGALVSRLSGGGDDSTAKAIVSRLRGGALKVEMRGRDRRIANGDH